MLIDFRVKNFRSLRDEHVLSLVASTDKTLLELNTLPSGVASAPRLLRCAVVYGPNAGGKSNLLRAIQYMRGVIVESATVIQPGTTYNVQPFRLDPETSVQPSEFEVTFVMDGVRHQYGFSMTAERIISEYLLVYKKAKPQQWFDRRFDPESGKDIYDFGSGLKGKKSIWESATRPNALFLSMAAQLNSEALGPVFNWFSNNLAVYNETNRLNVNLSVGMLQDPIGKKAICDFLVAADISIADIQVVTRVQPTQSVHLDMVAGKTEVREELQEIRELQFKHVTEKGEAVFAYHDESNGTRNLLSLTGHMLDILKHGKTLVVDELDGSLHPKLVRRIVQLFQDPVTNPNGAQLIFSAHDVSLLDPDFLRRDQVWFVEKDLDQASKLFPLSDFSPRKNEAFGPGYLNGRYGALPFFGDWSAVH